MKASDIIASVGVIILFIAFLMNLYGKLPASNKYYKLMNFAGAAINADASYMVKFYPFILLEAVWAIVALLSLFNVPRGTSAIDE
jgi:hypothetical protein